MNQAESAPRGELATTRPHPTHVHVLRLLPEDDILVELQRFATDRALSAAYVNTCVGSTGKTRLRMAGQSNVIGYKGKFEIVSMTGTLSSSGHHLHMSIADSDGNVFGGHMVEGCIARTTVEIVLGIVEGVTFTRQLDSRTGFKELYLQEEDTVSTTHHPAAPEPQPSNTSPSPPARVVSNISLWSYIIGDDMVGLPVSSPAYSLWSYIAGADRVPGCRPAANSVGMLGYIIGEDRLLDT